MPTIVDRGLTEYYTPTPAWRRILRMPFAYARKRYVMWRYNLPDPETHEPPKAKSVIRQWPSTPEEIKLNDEHNRYYDAHINAIQKRINEYVERAKSGETQ